MGWNSDTWLLNVPGSESEMSPLYGRSRQQWHGENAVIMHIILICTGSY